MRRSVFGSSVTDLGMISMRDSTSEDLITALPSSRQNQEESSTGLWK